MRDSGIGCHFRSQQNNSGLGAPARVPAGTTASFTSQSFTGDQLMSGPELVATPGIGIQLGNDRVAAVTDTDTGRACVEAVLDCEPRRVYELLGDYPNLSDHIVGLREAAVLAKSHATTSVQFTMKLPFPIGQVRWTNLITAQESAGTYRIKWSLIEGDLSACSGSIVLQPVGERGLKTKASYQIHVSHRSRLPKRAERMAVNWLLPRVVRKLCAKLESAAQEPIG